MKGNPALTPANKGGRHGAIIELQGQTQGPQGHEGAQGRNSEIRQRQKSQEPQASCSYSAQRGAQIRRPDSEKEKEILAARANVQVRSPSSYAAEMEGRVDN